MSFIRKLIIVLVGVSLALLVTVLLLSPDAIMSLAFNIRDTSAFIRLPLAIIIDIIVLALIVLLVRNERTPTAVGGLTVKAQGAHADVSIESARERILRAVREVPDVLSAQVEVKALRGKADVDLDVLVSRHSINIPEKQKEIDRALRQVINKQLGLQMAGKPRVHIRLDDEPAAAVTPVVSPVMPVLAPPVPVVEAPKTETVVVAEPVVEPKPDTAESYTEAMLIRSKPEDDAKPEEADKSLSS